MRELEIAERACVAGGKVALKYFQSDFEVRHKGKIDLVTDADVECERKIKSVISEEFPNHAFLGEESGSHGSSRHVWVIDPIDGTTNFVHGVDYFCHSVALVKDSSIVCGAVYNPVHKKLYKAYSGKGAFLNGKRISVSGVGKLIDSLIVTGFPYEASGHEDKTINAVSSLRGNCQGVRRFGAAALDFCMVADGSCDGFFEYFLNPWDVAAGIIIAREAGGKVTDINGSEATPNSGHFLASNSLLHEQIKSHLGAVD